MNRPRIVKSARLRISLLGVGLIWLGLNNQCYSQVNLPASNSNPYFSGLLAIDPVPDLKIDDLNADEAVESDNIGGFCFPVILEGPGKGSSFTTSIDRLRNGATGISSEEHQISAPPPLFASPVQQGRVVVKRFHIGKAILQSFYFTALMNGWRIATEPSTRKDLKGPFWADYVGSVESLRGWRDGDEFYVNYVGHPMQGGVSGFIQIQNDERSTDLQVGRNPEYWKSRLRAMGWAALVSCQFELGPFGESSIGNVGLKPDPKSRHPMAYVDLTITPTLGLAWIVGEDIVDRYVIQKIEARYTNRYLRALSRSFLNPSHSFANLFRGRWPWYRDTRTL